MRGRLKEVCGMSNAIMIDQGDPMWARVRAVVSAQTPQPTSSQPAANQQPTNSQPTANSLCNLQELLELPERIPKVFALEYSSNHPDDHNDYFLPSRELKELQHLSDLFTSLLEVPTLDDANSHGVLHITHSESTKRWEVGEGCNANVFSRKHWDHSSTMELVGFGGSLPKSSNVFFVP
nr:hypothetical protein HmN_000783800 [Hymenolepis microstoma]